MEQIWNAFLELTAKLVTPDWGALIALIPIGLAAIVALFFARTIVRFATAGPTRRGPVRFKPVPPPGVHAPGPSFAPILAAAGTGLLFFGLVFGGVALALAVAALVFGLLYWGAEGMREYDHLEHREIVPIVAPREPPPGIHAPGPSFRPILASLGVAILFFGLVFGGWVLAVGVVTVAVSLLGWLGDAGHEYRAVEAADRTGQLPHQPAPAWPIATLAVFTVLVVGAAVLNLGILPPSSAVGGGDGSSPAPNGSPPASVAPEADVAVSATGAKFDPTQLQAPVDTAFTIGFANNDAGVLHNVFITNADGAPVEMGDTKPFPGPKAVVYNVAPLPAGTYTFICVVHPTTMIGELVAR